MKCRRSASLRTTRLCARPAPRFWAAVAVLGRTSFAPSSKPKPTPEPAPDAFQIDQLRSSVPRNVRCLRALAAPGGPGVSAQGTARPGPEADGGEASGSGGPHAGRCLPGDPTGLRALRQRARRADRAAYASGAAARARLHRAADGQPRTLPVVL